MDSEQFWERVDKTDEDGCWPWTGARNNEGYGNLWWDGKWRKATHVMWLQVHGSLPKQSMLHRCDNPPCVRVDHLFEGDQTTNMRDKTAKGRHHNKVKTECKFGHPFTVENTYHYVWNGQPRRKCKKCAAAATKRHYWRAKEGSSHR